MDTHQINQFNKSKQFKKSNILPPINHSPNSKRKQNKSIQKTIIQSKKQSSSIKPSDSNITKKQRKFIVDQYDQKAIVLCQFCGGQSCPQQNYLTNKKQPNAIQGLHSNWITQNILAMQRPSNRLIQKFNLLQTFTKYGINSILNLQQPGQHPYCADGIDPMIGFSYDPQLFFNKKIRYQNQFWEDMTATTFQQMMKIMNVFSRSILQRRGKISVHCHAGRGRTLMAICSWLIYNDRMTAEQTINLAVQKRQGVLTRNSQRDFLRDFEKQLQRRWRSYNINIENQTIRSFTQFVSWQNVSLLKSQKKKIHQAAFVHGIIMSMLRNRMKYQCKQILYAFIDLNDKTVFTQHKWDKQHDHRVNFLKTYLDKKKLQHFKENQDVRVLVTLLQDFYDNLPFTPISLHAIDQLKEELQTEKLANKNQGQKRNIKKQALNNKILKTWDDILKQRQGFSNVISNKQQIKKDQIKENIKSQLGIQSRVKQIQDQNKIVSPQFNQKKLQTGGSNFLTVPHSTQFFPQNTRLSSDKSFIKSQQNIQSQIQFTTLYLNVLTEPSIVHEVGVHSLCTFIDFVKFAIQLLNCYKQAYPKQSQEHYTLMERCLLAKFSLLLQSKKRYFPVLFRGANLRESNLMKKIQKLDKYSNSNIKYMAEHFMKDLIEQFKVVFKDEGINGQKFQKLILKIQKVDTNIDHFSKSHASSGGKFFSAADAKKVYDQARI